MNNQYPIGVFDSGLGGLTVLKSLKEYLPKENYIYIGDTAHVPYGNKSKESIIQFSAQIIKYLEKRQVKLIIIACNTVSSICIKELMNITKIPIIDVISPLKNYFNKTQNITRIGVIGTENTIQSQAYDNFLAKIKPNIKVFSKACPMLVPIIEAGLIKHQIARIMTKEYLESLIQKKIDHLILGCTHYPLLIPLLHSILPQKVSIIDSATITSKVVTKYLHNNSNNNFEEKPSTEIYITDKKSNFKKVATAYLNLPIINIEHLNIS